MSDKIMTVQVVCFMDRITSVSFKWLNLPHKFPEHLTLYQYS